MATTLQARLDGRARTLVGRAREQTALRAALRGDGPVVTHLHGIGGVGKSALLRWLAAEARAEDVPVVALDARELEPTEQGLRDALASAPLDAPRTLLLVDTYELLTMLDPWVRRTFVPGLPGGVRVVLAGREPPSAAWHREYGELVQAVRVENLAPEDAERVLAASGMGGEQARRVNGVVRGHPLALVLAGAALRDEPGLPAEGTATGTMVQDVARTYLDALDPPTRRALEAASVTRRTTLSLLGAMLPDEAPGDAFARLRDLPFVELGREGLVVHDTVREATALRLRAVDPGAYHAYRAAAWRCLRAEMRGGARADLWRWTADMLYLIEDRNVRENFFPSVRMEHQVTPAEPGDWPEIAEVAEAAGRDVALVRRWWEAIPSGFAVARDAEGRMSAFRCAYEPDGVSPRLVDGDPVASAWRQHLRDDPVPKGARVVLVRFSARREVVEGGFDAALAAMLLDGKRMYVAMRPALRRIYAHPVRGSVSHCAMTLGYVPVPTLPETMYNDLGPGSIDGWLADLGARELLEADEDLAVGDRRVVLDGVAVELTRLEAEVLAHLKAREGRAVPHEELLREVWGHEWTGGSNVVQVVVSGLRRKLGDRAAAIETVRGVGYRLRGL
jgi:DNA-binding winged helix-turn-helix (wHTH) protein